MLIITIPIQLHAVSLNLPSGKARPRQSNPKSFVSTSTSTAPCVERRGHRRSAPLESRMKEKAAQSHPARDSPASQQAGEVWPGGRGDGFRPAPGPEKLGMIGNEQFIK